MNSKSKKKFDIKKTVYYQYAQNVIDGKVIAGELIKLACKRFIDDLQREDFYFDYEIVDKFITFSSCIKHFKGNSSGKPFILEPFQQWIAANILGFYWKDSKVRRFTSSIICMARKNGKDALAALFSLWFLLFDGEEGAECDCVATTRDQAAIAFEFCEMYAKQLDPKEKDLKRNRNQILLKDTASKINVFASDASKLDGFNAHFAIIDEYHAHRDSKLIDVLRSSMGSRTQPHLMVISTMGFDLTSPFYRAFQVGSEILHNVKQDDSQFLALYVMDEGDDWKDENNWIKANPNLGVTISKKYLQEQVVEATNNKTSEVGILTKNFNIACRTREVWMPDEYLLNSFSDFNIEDFKDKEVFCYIGVDLSAVSDLTAISFLIVDEDDNKSIYTDFFLPESALTDSSNKEFYRYLTRTNQLHLTEGNVVDYDYLLKRIKEVNDILPIRKLYYDAWNATQFAVNATAEGLPLEPYSQSIGSFNKPTKELERLIRKGEIQFAKSELMTFCFRNVTIKEDFNQNCKPVKINPKSELKIDGVISSLMALAAYLSEPRYTNELIII